MFKTVPKTFRAVKGWLILNILQSTTISLALIESLIVKYQSCYLSSKMKGVWTLLLNKKYLGYAQLSIIFINPTMNNNHHTITFIF